MTLLRRILAAAQRIFGPGRRSEPDRPCPTLASCGLELEPDPGPFIRVSLEALRRARP